ncbi:MAG: methylmalonyl-CoA mutase family protein [Ekhidna sp.]|nr:methylmalonyl-CoA mutase family protein [Ekhidna sp.]
MKDIQFSDFPKANFDDWLSAAKKQLKKEDPLSELIWESHETPSLNPYYDSTDLSELTNQVQFFQKLPPHQWKLYEEIQVKNEREANSEALEGLAGGCDGIIFNLSNEIDTELLLKGIDTSSCDVSTFSVYQKGIFTRMNCDNTLVEGNTSSSPASQISEILDGLKHQKHIYRNSFSDFFSEIATVRALRYFLASEKGIPDVFIHSSIQPHSNPEYQWFTNTIAGLASILGGSHSISLPTAIGDKRITRNVGNLIREESKITSYSDQCGGSYFVESLTAKIVELVKESIR